LNAPVALELNTALLPTLLRSNSVAVEAMLRCKIKIEEAGKLATKIKYQS